MSVPVNVNLIPNTRKVDQALDRIRSQARNVDFGSGARSLNKLSQPLGRITGQATEFEKSLEASNARVLAFGASVAVINKLSQAFSSLVSNTIKVEATFAKINTVLNGTEKQVQQFGRAIFQVARDTGTSFDQVAEGALELARQGLSAQDTISRISTALKLVRVTGIDAEKAVGGLTAAIKGFEGAGLTVAQIADKLSEADVNFAVSTKDLIEGLQRASASARVAGVSFDELLASITVVQERTQRGGAVIGNAFKTIFSYIARPETINYLESLGIQVVDSQGRIRDAIPVIRDLGKYLERIGMQSETASMIIQKVAGVRQRDILINLIEDLNSGQSQFNKSLMVTESAVGSLDQKQRALNDTLEFFINKTVTAGQEFAAMLGKIGFTDAAKGILDSVSSALEGITDLLDGDSIGSKFAQGLVRGIGGILTGPGLILVGGIFLKLFADLAKFGLTSLKNLLGINKAAQQQQALQQSIFQTLVSNETIQREILLLGNDKVAQAQLLNKIYKDQIKALTRIQSISASVSPMLYGAGLRGGQGGVSRGSRGGTAAGGYISQEASAISRGVGGAPTSAKVAVIPNFAFGRGERGTMVANTSEYYVPNYAGGGDAIFNQNMIRSMGLPKGAMKINAAGGYIPNYVKPSISIGKAGITSAEAAMRAGYTRSQISQAFGKKESDRLFGAAKVGTSKEPLAYGNNPIEFAMIVAQPLPQMGQLKEFAHQNKKYGYYLVGYKDPLTKIEKGVKNDEQLDEDTRSFAINAARQQAKLLTGGIPNPNFEKKLINKGAISALSGSIFEAAVSSVLRSKDFDSGDANRAFDFYGSGANKRLQSLFSLPLSATNIEAKIRDSKDSRSSMRGKILKKMGVAALGYIPNFAMSPLEDAIGREQAAGVPINQIRVNQSGKLRNAQNPMGLAVTNTQDEPTGAIPNFANPPRRIWNQGYRRADVVGAGFEWNSAGVRAYQDSLDRARRATNEHTKATTDNIGKLFLLSSAMTGLSSAFGQTENSALKFGLGLTNAGVNFALYHGMLKDAFAGMAKSARNAAAAMILAGRRAGSGTAAGGALIGAGAMVGRLSALAGPAAIATSLGIALAPLIMDVMKTKDAFSELREKIKNIRSEDLIAGNKDQFQAIIQAIREDAALRRGARSMGMPFDGDEVDVEASEERALQMANQGFSRISISGGYNYGRTANEIVSYLFKNIETFRRLADERQQTLSDQIVNTTDQEAKAALSREHQDLPIFDDRFLGTQLPKFVEQIMKSLTFNLPEGSEVQREQALRERAKSVNIFGENFDFSNLIKSNNMDFSPLAKELSKAFLFEEFSKNAALFFEEFQVEAAKITTGNLEDYMALMASLLAKYGLPKNEGDIPTPEGKILAKDALRKLRTQYSDISYKSQLEYLGINDPRNSIEGTSRSMGLDSSGLITGDPALQMRALDEVGGRPFAKEGSLEYYKNRLTYDTLSAEKTLEIQQAMERLTFDYEKANKLRQADVGILEKALTINGEYTALDKGKFKILQDLIAGQHSFRQLQTEIKNLTGQEVELTQEQYEELLRRRDTLLDELGISEQLLLNEQKRAEYLAMPKGFAKSLEESSKNLLDDQGLRMLGDTLGDKIPNRFADSMTTALNNLATGAYDSLENVFGQIALDFGNMLLEEINRAVAAQIVGSIMKGSFGKMMGGFFQGLFPGFATGGYINQGSGVKDDVPAMLMGGEYVVRKAAVQKYGVNFLESLNQGQVEGYAAGGVVQGAGNFYDASNFWKDPKGNMMGGAASNARLARAKQTDFFMPGYRGAGAISGKENLLAFAMQGTTSGATDTFSRRGTGFSFDTELQSRNLSGRGRIRAMESPIGQGLMSAKQQAFDLYTQRISEEQRVVQAKKDAEQARSETFKKAVIGAAISSVAAGVAGSLNKPSTPQNFDAFSPKAIFQPGASGLGDSVSLPLSAQELSNQIFGGFLKPGPGGANGGYFPSVRKFANGGAANAMLMGGEYIMSPQATSGIGRTMLDDINNMRYPMPVFANGGARGAAPMKSGSSGADIGELNININIEKSGNASVDSSMSSDSSGDPQQSKEFAKKIKDVVVKVIQEEKRVSGSLFTRNK